MNWSHYIPAAASVEMAASYTPQDEHEDYRYRVRLGAHEHVHGSHEPTGAQLGSLHQRGSSVFPAIGGRPVIGRVYTDIGTPEIRHHAILDSHSYGPASSQRSIEQANMREKPELGYSGHPNYLGHFGTEEEAYGALKSANDKVSHMHSTLSNHLDHRHGQLAGFITYEDPHTKQYHWAPHGTGGGHFHEEDSGDRPMYPGHYSAGHPTREAAVHEAIHADWGKPRSVHIS